MEGKRQLERRDFGKRLSLDSSLVGYMGCNKYLEHMLTQLEEQHRSLWREKLAVAQLQREVAQRRSEGAMHEKLIHELEEERHLRLQSEQRLQEVTLESERNRVQMHDLQQQFSRMEETVRNLLQSQGPPEQKKEETVNILVCQEELSEGERNPQEALEDIHVVVNEDLRSGSSGAEEGKEKTKWLLERLKALEVENSALALENESQRERYERCLDEVANQVVQALLTQKDLREECVQLKRRVFDLEQQNRTLSSLFQQQVRPASDVLLQKLHSHILDQVSSRDWLSGLGRSWSPAQAGSYVEMREYQLNAKPGAPTLKCPGLRVALPRHRCSPNSCSSSELSLSSTCSEHSSGSSCPWHDGKTPRERGKEASGNLQEDEEAPVEEPTLQSHIIESNCQMRTLDSGIGTFPLPDSGTRSTGRYMCKPDTLEDTEPALSLQPALSTASPTGARTLDREVPSSADCHGPADNAIVPSASDPIMTTKGVRPLQSRLPKPASSGKLPSHKQSEAEPKPQTCPSFESAEAAVATEPAWAGQDAAAAAAATQDKVPRKCVYSASRGSGSDSDPDFGKNGFGAGRGKLVKTTQSATQGDGGETTSPWDMPVKPPLE
ncbi:nck-associated protein 5 [Tenrec ecaudatus]|uniref:nck-associated protein 5 n=1 Tax=Tenrec ecaudatus TaxID=94439 RepID=UPI003F59A31C